MELTAGVVADSTGEGATAWTVDEAEAVGVVTEDVETVGPDTNVQGTIVGVGMVEVAATMLWGAGIS